MPAYRVKGTIDLLPLLLLGFITLTTVLVVGSVRKQQELRGRAEVYPTECAVNGNYCIPSGEFCDPGDLKGSGGACGTGEVCCQRGAGPRPTPLPSPSPSTLCEENVGRCWPDTYLCNSSVTLPYTCPANQKCVSEITSCYPRATPSPSPFCTNGTTCFYGYSTCGNLGRYPGSGTCAGGICCGNVIPRPSPTPTPPPLRYACQTNGQCTTTTGTGPNTYDSQFLCVNNCFPPAPTPRPSPRSTPSSACIDNAGKCQPNSYICTPSTILSYYSCPSGQKCVGEAAVCRPAATPKPTPQPSPSPASCSGLCYYGYSSCGILGRTVASGTCSGGICCGNVMSAPRTSPSPSPKLTPNCFSPASCITRGICASEGGSVQSTKICALSTQECCYIPLPTTAARPSPSPSTTASQSLLSKCQTSGQGCNTGNTTIAQNECALATNTIGVRCVCDGSESFPKFKIDDICTQQLVDPKLLAQTQTTTATFVGNTGQLCSADLTRVVKYVIDELQFGEPTIEQTITNCKASGNICIVQYGVAGCMTPQNLNVVINTTQKIDDGYYCDQSDNSVRLRVSLSQSLNIADKNETEARGYKKCQLNELCQQVSGYVDCLPVADPADLTKNFIYPEGYCLTTKTVRTTKPLGTVACPDGYTCVQQSDASGKYARCAYSTAEIAKLQEAALVRLRESMVCVGSDGKTYKSGDVAYVAPQTTTNTYFYNAPVCTCELNEEGFVKTDPKTGLAICAFKTTTLSGKLCTKNEDCGTGNICLSTPYGSACVPADNACGQAGKNCCVNNTCNSNLRCDTSTKTCLPDCGGEGELVCTGNRCATGYELNRSTNRCQKTVRQENIAGGIVKYECAKDGKTLIKTVSHGTRSGVASSSTSTEVCYWGCDATSNVCRNPTPEEARLYRSSILQNAIEREVNKCLNQAGADPTKCTPAAVYSSAVANLQPEELSPTIKQVFNNTNQYNLPQDVYDKLVEEEYLKLLGDTIVVDDPLSAPDYSPYSYMSTEQAAKLRESAKANVDRILSIGTLNPGSIDRLTAGNEVWDKVGELSYTEMLSLAGKLSWENLTDNSKSPLDRVVGGVLSLTETARIWGTTRDPLSGESQQALYSQYLCGSEVMGNELGDQFSPCYQQQKVKERLDQCNIYSWQRELTPAQEACLKGESLGIKIAIDELQQRRVETAALTVATGVASTVTGGTAGALVKGASTLVQIAVRAAPQIAIDIALAPEFARIYTGEEEARATMFESLAASTTATSEEKAVWTDMATQARKDADIAYEQNKILGMVTAVGANIGFEALTPLGKAVFQEDTFLGRILFGRQQVTDIVDDTIVDQAGNLWRATDPKPLDEIIDPKLPDQKYQVLRYGFDGKLIEEPIIVTGKQILDNPPLLQKGSVIGWTDANGAHVTKVGDKGQFITYVNTTSTAKLAAPVEIDPVRSEAVVLADALNETIDIDGYKLTRTGSSISPGSLTEGTLTIKPPDAPTLSGRAAALNVTLEFAQPGTIVLHTNAAGINKMYAVDAVGNLLEVNVNRTSGAAIADVVEGSLPAATADKLTADLLARAGNRVVTGEDVLNFAAKNDPVEVPLTTRTGNALNRAKDAIIDATPCIGFHLVTPAYAAPGDPCNVALKNALQSAGDVFQDAQTAVNKALTGNQQVEPTQPIIIGRNTTNHTGSHIDTNNRLVSKTHAEVYVDQSGQLVIKDDGSSYGTWINGKRIGAERQVSEPVPLKGGDTVNLAPPQAKAVEYKVKVYEDFKPATGLAQTPVTIITVKSPQNLLNVGPDFDATGDIVVFRTGDGNRHIALVNPVTATRSDAIEIVIDGNKYPVGNTPSNIVIGDTTFRAVRPTVTPYSVTLVPVPSKSTFQYDPTKTLAQPGNSVTLPPGTHNLGTQFDASVNIPAEGVSRSHATVIEEYGVWRIIDHSKNGTRVNGVDLPNGSSIDLKNGDIIQLVPKSSEPVYIRADISDGQLTVTRISPEAPPAQPAVPGAAAPQPAKPPGVPAPIGGNLPECVTGDTLLRRRRKPKVKNQKSKLSGGWDPEDFEDITIKNIKPGDEILTLDETTGKFVPQVVEKLVKKGIQQTYLLVTESGKQIRTTSEHPYLVHSEQEKTSDMSTNFLYHDNFSAAETVARNFYENVLEGTSIRVLALDNEPVSFSHQGWDHIYESHRSKFDLITRFYALPKAVFVLALAKNEVDKNPRVLISNGRKISYWAVQGVVEGVWTRVVIRSINDGPKHFYSVIWKGEEYRSEVKNAIKKGAVSRLYPRLQASRKPLAFSTSLWKKYTKFISNLQDSEKELSLSPRVEKSTQLGRRRELVIPQLFSKSFTSKNRTNVKWIKVKNIETGSQIATIDGWERVAAVRKAGRRHVYDIEISGTHNFVGNGIVAHNTALDRAAGALDAAGDQVADVPVVGRAINAVFDASANSLRAIDESLNIGQPQKTIYDVPALITEENVVSSGITELRSPVDKLNILPLEDVTHFKIGTDQIVRELGLENPRGSNLGSSANVYVVKVDIDGVQKELAAKAFRVDRDFIKPVNVILKNEVEKVQVVDQLGIGPRFYGTFTFSDGRVGYLVDLIKGGFHEDVPASWVTPQVINDLRTINTRLTAAGYYQADLQYFVTTDGRALIIDAGGLGSISDIWNANKEALSDPKSGITEDFIRSKILQYSNLYNAEADRIELLILEQTQSQNQLAKSLDELGDRAAQSVPVVGGAINSALDAGADALNIVDDLLSGQSPVSDAGRCVTGDSMLVTAGGQSLRVDQVKGGEVVYALDEKSGQFVSTKIQELLYMGIKPVYKLTTASGRSIKTTSNHPYLVADASGKPLAHTSPIIGAGWVKVEHLRIGDEIAVADDSLFTLGGFLGKNVVDDGYSNDKERRSDLALSKDLIKGHTSSSRSSSALIPNFQNTITRTISRVNTTRSLVANTEANQKTTKFEQTAENILSFGTVNSNERFINFHTTISPVGMQWDRIVAIEPVGTEHVWDIAMEGTHNFVANAIVAHNTALDRAAGALDAAGDRAAQNIPVIGPGINAALDAGADGLRAVNDVISGITGSKPVTQTETVGGLEHSPLSPENKTKAVLQPYDRFDPATGFPDVDNLAHTLSELYPDTLELEKLPLPPQETKRAAIEYLEKMGYVGQGIRKLSNRTPYADPVLIAWFGLRPRLGDKDLLENIAGKVPWIGVFDTLDLDSADLPIAKVTSAGSASTYGPPWIVVDKPLKQFNLGQYADNPRAVGLPFVTDSINNYSFIPPERLYIVVPTKDHAQGLYRTITGLFLLDETYQGKPVGDFYKERIFDYNALIKAQELGVELKDLPQEFLPLYVAKQTQPKTGSAEEILPYGVDVQLSVVEGAGGNFPQRIYFLDPLVNDAHIQILDELPAGSNMTVTSAGSEKGQTFVKNPDGTWRKISPAEKAVDGAASALGVPCDPTGFNFYFVRPAYAAGPKPPCPITVRGIKESVQKFLGGQPQNPKVDTSTEITIPRPIDAISERTTGVKRHLTSAAAEAVLYKDFTGDFENHASLPGPPLEEDKLLTRTLAADWEIQNEQNTPSADAFYTLSFPADGRSDRIFLKTPLIARDGTLFPALKRKGIGAARQPILQQGQAFGTPTLLPLETYPSAGFDNFLSAVQDASISEDWIARGIRVRRPYKFYDLERVSVASGVQNIEYLQRMEGIRAPDQAGVNIWAVRNPYSFNDVVETLRPPGQPDLRLTPVQAKTKLDEILQSQAAFLQYESDPTGRALAPLLVRGHGSGETEWLEWLARMYGQQVMRKTDQGIIHGEMHRQNSSLGVEFSDLADQKHRIIDKPFPEITDEADVFELTSEAVQVLYPILELKITFNLANNRPWNQNLAKIIDIYIEAMEKESPHAALLVYRMKDFVFAHSLTTSSRYYFSDNLYDGIKPSIIYGTDPKLLTDVAGDEIERQFLGYQIEQRYHLPRIFRRAVREALGFAEAGAKFRQSISGVFRSPTTIERTAQSVIDLNGGRASLKYKILQKLLREQQEAHVFSWSWFSLTGYIRDTIGSSIGGGANMSWELKVVLFEKLGIEKELFEFYTLPPENQAAYVESLRPRGFLEVVNVFIERFFPPREPVFPEPPSLPTRLKNFWDSLFGRGGQEGPQVFESREFSPKGLTRTGPGFLEQLGYTWQGWVDPTSDGWQFPVRHKFNPDDVAIGEEVNKLQIQSALRNKSPEFWEEVNWMLSNEVRGKLTVSDYPSRISVSATNVDKTTLLRNLVNLYQNDPVFYELLKRLIIDPEIDMDVKQFIRSWIMGDLDANQIVLQWFYNPRKAEFENFLLGQLEKDFLDHMSPSSTYTNPPSLAAPLLHPGINMTLSVEITPEQKNMITEIMYAANFYNSNTDFYGIISTVTNGVVSRYPETVQPYVRTHIMRRIMELRQQNAKITPAKLQAHAEQFTQEIDQILSKFKRLEQETVAQPLRPSIGVEAQYLELDRLGMGRLVRPRSNYMYREAPIRLVPADFAYTTATLGFPRSGDFIYEFPVPPSYSPVIQSLTLQELEKIQQLMISGAENPPHALIHINLGDVRFDADQKEAQDLQYFLLSAGFGFDQVEFSADPNKTSWFVTEYKGENVVYQRTMGDFVPLQSSQAGKKQFAVSELRMFRLRTMTDLYKLLQYSSDLGMLVKSSQIPPVNRSTLESALATQWQNLHKEAVGLIEQKGIKYEKLTSSGAESGVEREKLGEIIENELKTIKARGKQPEQLDLLVVQMRDLLAKYRKNTLDLVKNPPVEEAEIHQLFGTEVGVGQNDVYEIPQLTATELAIPPQIRQPLYQAVNSIEQGVDNVLPLPCDLTGFRLVAPVYAADKLPCRYNLRSVSKWIDDNLQNKSGTTLPSTNSFPARIKNFFDSILGRGGQEELTMPNMTEKEVKEVLDPTELESYISKNGVTPPTGQNDLLFSTNIGIRAYALKRSETTDTLIRGVISQTAERVRDEAVKQGLIDKFDSQTIARMLAPKIVAEVTTQHLSSGLSIPRVLAGGKYDLADTICAASCVDASVFGREVLEKGFGIKSEIKRTRLGIVTTHHYLLVETGNIIDPVVASKKNYGGFFNNETDFMRRVNAINSGGTTVLTKQLVNLFKLQNKSGTTLPSTNSLPTHLKNLFDSILGRGGQEGAGEGTDSLKNMQNMLAIIPQIFRVFINPERVKLQDECKGENSYCTVKNDKEYSFSCQDNVRQFCPEGCNKDTGLCQTRYCHQAVVDECGQNCIETIDGGYCPKIKSILDVTEKVCVPGGSSCSTIIGALPCCGTGICDDGRCKNPSGTITDPVNCRNHPDYCCIPKDSTNLCAPDNPTTDLTAVFGGGDPNSPKVLAAAKICKTESVYGTIPGITNDGCLLSQDPQLQEKLAGKGFIKDSFRTYVPNWYHTNEYSVGLFQINIAANLGFRDFYATQQGKSLQIQADNYTCDEAFEQLSFTEYTGLPDTDNPDYIACGNETQCAAMPTRDEQNGCKEKVTVCRTRITSTPYCKIVNKPLFASCNSWFSEPKNNVAFAAWLSHDGTIWDPWSAATACRIVNQ